jgi:hypothetical protein
MALHKPNLVRGIAASLRTLIVASFRAPASHFVLDLLRRLNPTIQMLKATTFCVHHSYIFALLCLLNVNMGALDLSGGAADEGSESNVHAHALLHSLASIYDIMDRETKQAVYKVFIYIYPSYGPLCERLTLTPHHTSPHLTTPHHSRPFYRSA